MAFSDSDIAPALRPITLSDLEAFGFKMARICIAAIQQNADRFVDDQKLTNGLTKDGERSFRKGLRRGLTMDAITS